VPVEAQQSLGIGDMPQLFADDYLVASRNNIRRIAHQASTFNEGKPIFTGGCC